MRYEAGDRFSIINIFVFNWERYARSRPLSGGESFLVSLSLALALSELSSGRSRL
ncbi:MAG: hypothetical protein K8R34_05095 [Methanosarcinales archaeon]|nr:hypothetical protein [Methanosarcinales archaeon]